MTEKLSMEERAAREADARIFDETLQLVQQFSALRAKFPDLSDEEYAHRMVATKRDIKKFKRLLEGDKK